jgi:hypothetical protein
MTSRLNWSDGMLKRRPVAGLPSSTSPSRISRTRIGVLGAEAKCTTLPFGKRGSVDALRPLQRTDAHGAAPEAVRELERCHAQTRVVAIAIGERWAVWPRRVAMGMLRRRGSPRAPRLPGELLRVARDGSG